MPKFLIIQTAFTGDVVLATAIAEKIHAYYPDAQIDFLLRKGNEGLLNGHPFITNVIIWDKKEHKNRNLLQIVARVRKEKYTHIINPHRFASSGLVTLLSGASYKAGFAKNPLSFCYSIKVPHIISEPYTKKPMLDIERNQLLIAGITDDKAALPSLYPSAKDRESIKQYQKEQYICIAPASVWFTKAFPPDKWVSMIDLLPADHDVYIIGGLGDVELGADIASKAIHPRIHNLCGKLNYLESAALMQHAKMNYSNDSAPLHFANAMRAPLTAVYCSTVPAFGFGPLLDTGRVVEIEEKLYCRPCGLHGYNACPEGHFRCALEIKNEQLLWWNLNKT